MELVTFYRKPHFKTIAITTSQYYYTDQQTDQWNRNEPHPPTVSQIYENLTLDKVVTVDSWVKYRQLNKMYWDCFSTEEKT